jgi:hypothetical protein
MLGGWSPGVPRALDRSRRTLAAPHSRPNPCDCSLGWSRAREPTPPLQLADSLLEATCGSGLRSHAIQLTELTREHLRKAMWSDGLH